MKISIFLLTITLIICKLILTFSLVPFYDVETGQTFHADIDENDIDPFSTYEMGLADSNGNLYSLSNQNINNQNDFEINQFGGGKGFGGGLGGYGGGLGGYGGGFGGGFGGKTPAYIQLGYGLSGFGGGKGFGGGFGGHGGHGGPGGPGGKKGGFGGGVAPVVVVTKPQAVPIAVPVSSGKKGGYGGGFGSTFGGAGYGGGKFGGGFGGFH